MNDKIDREGQRKLPDHGNQGQLEGVRAGAGYVVGGRCILILKTELEMFEPGIDQGGKTILLQPDARGNHVDVKPGIASCRDQLNQITANQRLASGEMKMQHTQSPGLPEHSLPVFRRQLVFSAVQRDRIGAIETVQRAAVGQLSNQ